MALLDVQLPWAPWDSSNPGAQGSWGNIRVTVGLYGENGKQNGNYYMLLRVEGLGLKWDFLGIMEKKMETTIHYLGYRVKGSFGIIWG